MRCLAIVPVVISCIFLATALGDDKSVKAVIECRLSLERGPYAREQAIPCRFLVKNNTKEAQSISLHAGKDISLQASGPDEKPYKVVWRNDALTAGEAKSIVLQPGCELDMALAAFTLADNQGMSGGLPTGQYSISAAWKSEEKAASLSPIVGKQEVEIAERAFRVKLNIEKQRHALKDPINVQFSLENDGPVPIRILNYFYPIENHFLIAVKRMENEGGGQDAIPPFPHEITLVTPEAGTGWITLQPDEKLRLVFDATNYFKEEGVYRLQVTYPRRLLMIDPGTKPCYTEQHVWKSEVIEVEIVADK